MKSKARIFAVVLIAVVSVVAQFTWLDLPTGGSMQIAHASIGYDRLAAFNWAIHNYNRPGTGNGDQCANFVAGALIHGGIELRNPADPIRRSVSNFFGNHLVLSALADLNLLNTGKIELFLARPSELANILLPGDVIFLNIVRMNNMGRVLTGQDALNAVRGRLQRASFYEHWDVGAGHSVVVIDRGRYAQWNVPQIGNLSALDNGYANSAIGVRIKTGNRTNPYTRVQAEDFTSQQGLLPVVFSDIIAMGYSQELNDHLQFHSLNFSQGASQVRIRYSSDMPDPWIRFRLHNLNGPVIASASLPRTGNWFNYQEVTINVFGVTQGTLFIEFRNIDFDWFIFTPGPSDTTPPSASITSPSDGSLINSNTLTITASATDSGSGVARVSFYRFVGTNWFLIGTDTTAPYEMTVNLSSLSDGWQGFAIRAVDNAGNWTNYIARSITLDRTPPTGIMVAPAPDSQTSAKRITLRANAADATSGVARVEYLAWSPEPWSNEQWIHIGTVYDPPYEFTWSIPHVNWYAFLMARIVDRAGNVRETFGNGNWTWFSVNLRPDTIGIFRPSQAAFYLRNQNTAGFANFIIPMGLNTDIPVAGDWDGDGIDTVGVYRPSTGMFYLKNTNEASAPVVYQFAFGAPSDVPIVGDWNGDGRDSVGVYRPSNGYVYLRDSLSAGFADYQMIYGTTNDQPVAGDWNGDGKDSIGVYRGNTFYLTNQTCNCVPIANYQFTLGTLGDVPFAGDWNRNGFDGVGVFRPTNGFIYLKNALTSGYADVSFFYGTGGDRPVAGVWTHAAGDQPSTQIDVTPSGTAQPEVAPTFVPRQ